MFDRQIYLINLYFFRRSLTVESKSRFMILSSFKTFNRFPYACAAYKILLTIPVIDVSAERSFSKLKLLKSCLQSTMSQGGLNSFVHFDFYRK